MMKDWSHLKALSKSKDKDNQIASLKSAIKSLEGELLTLKEQTDIRRKLNGILPKSIVSKKRLNSQSVAVAVASDWHSEETVRSALVNGVNEFNWEICQSRSDNFFRHIVQLVETQRHATHIDTLVLALLGDFISGHIHDDLIESTSASPTYAIRRVKRLLLGGIDYLRPHFKEIIIPTAIGNHSRLTKKPRCSTAFLHNFEQTMYEDLADDIKARGWKNVRFQISEGYHNYMDIYGKVIRFHHGDYIKYGGGIGGITIPVNKAISQWDRLKTADLDVFGHYHQFIASKKFICNGSLIGYNPFALQIKAEPEPPQQAFFLLNERYGRTITCPIIV